MINLGFAKSAAVPFGGFIKYFSDFYLLAGLYTFLGLVLSFLTFYPGWMTPDSYYQYLDSLSGTYNDWHPVIMAWFWRGVNFLHPGPAGFLAFNLIIYWISVALISIAMRKTSGVLAGGMILIVFSNPGLLSILGVIWKDVFFCCLSFLAIALALYVSLVNKKLFLFFLPVVASCGVLGIGSKPNGVFAIFVIYCLFFRAAGKSLVSSLRLAILLITICLGIIFGITSNLRINKSYPLQYIQTYDLLGISVRTGENLIPNYIQQKIDSAGKALAQYYYPGGNNLLFYNSFGNISTSDPQIISDLSGLWIDAILKHPIQYLDHRWANLSELLRLGESEPAYITNVGIVNGEEIGFVYKTNEMSRLVERLMINGIFFIPWVYVILHVASTAVLFSSGRLREISFLLSLSGWLFLLPHFFIAPASDYRYLYYFYLNSTLLFGLAVGTLTKAHLRKYCQLSAEKLIR